MEYIIRAVGYPSTKVYYDRKARIGGSSKWSFIKLFDTAIDGMTTTTTKLLTYILWSGIFLSAIFVLFFIGFLVISILNKAVHWNLLILSIINKRLEIDQHLLLKKIRLNSIKNTKPILQFIKKISKIY